MLKLNKAITLSGYSQIIEGENTSPLQVAYMSASINTDGSSNASISKSILNQEAYGKYRTEVRKDMSEFELEVYKIEDEIIGGISSGK